MAATMIRLNPRTASTPEAVGAPTLASSAGAWTREARTRSIVRRQSRGSCPRSGRRGGAGAGRGRPISTTAAVRSPASSAETTARMKTSITPGLGVYDHDVERGQRASTRTTGRTLSGSAATAPPAALWKRYSTARWHSTPLTARIRSSVPSKLRARQRPASRRALSISADACCRCSAALLRGRSRSSRARGCLVGVGWLPAAATGPPVVGSECMQRWQFTPGIGEPSSPVLSDWPRSAGRLGS